MAKKKKNSLRYRIFANNSRLMLLLGTLLALFIPLVVFAQTSTTVRTRVGDAKEADVIEAARHVKSAFDECNGGKTTDKPGLGSCLKEKLLSFGYSDSAVNAFEQRRITSFADSCIQCKGYVSIVFALITSEPYALVSGNANETMSLQSLDISDQRWEKISPTESPAPGDIGGYTEGFGHIFFVTEVKGVINVKALESNAVPCTITDDRWRISDSGRPLVYFRRVR